MTITINEKEYDAISFALSQVEDVVQSATNEDYIANADECCKALYSVMDKYKEARMKAREFQSVRAYVSERNRGMRSRDIDKLTRKVIKELRNGG